MNHYQATSIELLAGKCPIGYIFGFAKLVPTQSELIISKILSLQKKIHLSFFLYVFAESFIESYIGIMCGQWLYISSRC